MIKGRENQLKYLLFILVLLAFSFVGCAHRNSAIPYTTALNEAYQYDSQQTTVFAFNQSPKKGSDMQEDASNESMAFFDEDTEQVNSTTLLS